MPGFRAWGGMAPPPPKSGGNAVNAVLAKFRKDQAKSVAVVAEAAKEREEKLKKVAAGGNDIAFVSLGFHCKLVTSKP